MNLFLILLFTVSCGSYGWGMRGRIIGNQRGAYLPGALLGIIISLFTCQGAFKQLFPLFASIGAFGMSHGGTQTYGETLSFVLKSDTDSVYKGKAKLGYIAVFVKGAGWIGLCSYFIAFTMQFLNGRYNSIVYIIVMLVSPIIQALGRYIFNSPYDKEKGLFPKIYFSITRREEWGGHILLWAFLSLLSVLLNDWYTFGAACVGFISGGIGFSFGLFIFDKNSKNGGIRILRGLNKHNLIGNWKTMECIFGAVAFLLTTIYFLTAPFKFSGYLNYNNSWLSQKTLLSMLLLIVTFLMGIIVEPLGEYVNKKHNKVPSAFTFEVFGRVLLTYIPTIIIMFGSPLCAELGSFLYVAYFLAEKVGLEWFKKYKNKTAILIISITVFIMTLIHFAINGASLLFIMIIYTVLHIIPSFLYSFNSVTEKKRHGDNMSIVKKYGSDLLIEPHFFIETLIMIIIPCCVIK